jgi:hypothetical protein
MQQGRTFCRQNLACSGTNSARLKPSLTSFLSWLDGLVWNSAELSKTQPPVSHTTGESGKREKTGDSRTP